VRVAAAALVLSGCADPVVQLSLRISPDAQGFDISCATTVEVYVDGSNYPNDDTDYKGNAVHLDAAPTSWDDLHTKLRTAFTLPMPSDGLKAVELWGWAGDSGFSMPTVPPDMLFNGSTNYIGQDTMEIVVVPNVSCARAQIAVRPIDIMKLTQSAQATTAGKCTEAAIADTAENAGASFGTLSNRPVADAIDYWGGVDGAVLTAGVAVSSVRGMVGSSSCFAINGGMATNYSINCSTGAKGVCGATGEIEVATIDQAVLMASLASPYKEQYGSAVVVGVWQSNAGVAAPASGAKVALSNGNAGIVFYVEPDLNGLLAPIPNGTATGPHGLALVYTSQLQDLTITSGNLTKGIRVGVISGSPSASLVMMN
jgi:hypothetical protein